MDLSVIILNFNTKDLLRKCLESVFRSQTNFKFEVIVSDNGSTDGADKMVEEEFPAVKLIRNGKNLGFSKGNNIAIKQASGRYMLLLNSDTEVQPDTFGLCIRKLDSDSSIGTLGCKILLPNGELDKASRRKFPNPWNSFLRLFGLRRFSNYNVTGSYDEESEVDSVMGAFMMVPRAVIKKVGILDEEFFMYGEDLDWCWRIKSAGYKVLYFPSAQITHFKYGSASQIPFQTVTWAHDAMKIFYRKHYSSKHNWFFNQLVYLGIELRKYLVMLVNLFRSRKSVH